MKRFATLLVLLTAVTSTVAAQTLKFGHINSQELIGLMPERDSALVKLQTYTHELEDTIAEMQQEYRPNTIHTSRGQATWSAAVLESRKQR